MHSIPRNTRFTQLFVQLHSSLWFAPALVILANVLLAFGLVELDRGVDARLRQAWPRLFAVDAEGARSMLSAIAGSMATVAGVAFSITIVALALASNQYTSRVMRNFMRDRTNQVVLGIFIGAHLYCLLVMQTINGEEGAFVPSLAVLGGLALAVVASGGFILFVHHISATIQASDMAEAITRETLEAIDELYPEGSRGAGTALDPVGPAAWRPVPAQAWGHVQTVNHAALLALARRHGAAIRIESMAGDFVCIGQPLVSVAGEQPPGRALIAAVNSAYGIGGFRTIDQDPAFGIRQLVDMAIKALSPAINDSTTAVTCIQHIGVVLARCAARDMTRRHHAEAGVLRLITREHDFATLARLGFAQIVENAEGNTEVMLKVAETIMMLGGASAAPQVRDALRGQADIVEEIALRGARSADAAEALRRALDALRAVLRAPPGTDTRAPRRDDAPPAALREPRIGRSK